jgi:hypothetical protein
VGNFVDSILVQADSGAIDITYGNKVNDTVATLVLSMRPAINTTSRTSPVVWICGRSVKPNANLSILGTNNTDGNLLDKFLPQECRA